MISYTTKTDEKGFEYLIKTDEDGKEWFIPKDESNSDYQAYLANLDEQQAALKDAAN